ncbi:type II toxin-antitoxin system HipA family toxin [Glaciibacter superstes]|uniref:type II toxin-antitoxin system HipA family toxin n=1 Tax=Glaciibacter superstes TaxID=501023 RepID=UPI0003B41035|nr:HipA domain-containing protein [Glaciibacter superstes]
MNVVLEAHVYTDLGGGTPTFVGVLKPSFSGGRNLASASFQYDSGYLAHPRAYPISPELPLVPTRTFTPENMTIFGSFADASPDMWGKKLIQANHALRLEKQPGVYRKLGDFDFLLNVSDFTRMGALRLKAPTGGSWLASDSEAANIHDLERVIAVARRYEDQVASDEDLEYLSDIATSPGGARPKANVITEFGNLAIAKLPHSKDGNIDVESWEALALTLAENIGIRTPTFEHRRAGADKSVLVAHRFDRVGEDVRLGYMSASTAMELGTLSDSGVTYQEFADTISELSSQPAADLHEMFTRIALTVLINNVDDHWRNHGFLHDGSGWRLSPVFDVNPSTSHSVNSRAISEQDDPRNRDIRNLASVAESFSLTGEQAAAIVHSVADHVERWPAIANSFGIPVEQQKAMSRAFDTNQLSVAREYSPLAPPRIVDLAPPAQPGQAGAVWVAQHVRGGAQVAGHWRAARRSS